MNKKIPYIINFPKIGAPSTGFISIAEKENLPFIPKRIYWTFFTPEEVIRGHHAHHELEQILVAVAGKIEVNIESKTNEKFNFVLDKPDLGLYIPKMSWRTLKYTLNSVLVCIASEEYDEMDYIKDYKQFLKTI